MKPPHVISFILFSFFPILNSFAQTTPGYYGMGGQSFIYNASFPDTTAFILNGPGRMYKSSDRCLHWRPVIDSTMDLRDVAFLNHDTGIVTSSYGKVLVTYDGGTNFTVVQAAPQSVNLNRVVWGGNTAYAISGNIYKSIDYGLTWNYVSAVQCGGWGGQIGAYFLNDNIGFITQGNWGNAVWKTLNGGVSWTPYGTPGNGSAYAIEMVNSLLGYVSGESGKIYKTTNSGNAWALSSTISMGNGDVTDLDFMNADTGFAVYDSILYRTINGAQSWTPIFSALSMVFNKVEITNDSTLYILGAYGFIYVSRDLGQTWQTQISHPETNLVFFSRDTGVALADCDRIVETDDAGYTWHVIAQDYNINWNNYFMCFPDRMHGCILGDIGFGGAYFSKSNDGGITWVRTPFTVGEQTPTSLFFLDSLNGWASLKYNNMPILEHTTDGGISWNRNYVSTFSEPAKGLYFVSADTGFAIDPASGLKVTYNQGMTWSSVATPTPLNSPGLMYGQLKFISKDTGFLAIGLYILKTVDRGQTWSVLFVDPVMSTIRIDVQGDTIVAGGGYLRTSFDGGINWNTSLGPFPISTFYQVVLKDTIAYFNTFGGYADYRMDNIGNTSCNLIIQASNSITCDSILITTNQGLPVQWWLNGNPSVGDTLATLTLANFQDGDFVIASGQTCVSQSIIIQHTPIDSITQGTSISFCPGDTVYISVSGLNSNYLWSTGDTNDTIIIWQTGTIDVSCINQSGCLIQDTIQLFNYANPFAFAGFDTTICLGASVVLGSSFNGGSCFWSPNQWITSTSSCTPSTSPQNAIGYALTVTSVNGCVSYDSVNIGVIIPPIASITQLGDTLYCSLIGISYQWYRNNTLIPGATGQSYVISQNGYYKAEVVYASGCSMMSYQILGIYSGVGLQEGFLDKQYELVIPNPSNGKFTIVGSEDLGQGTREIEIYNMLGEMIFQFETQNPKLEIDLSNQSNGIYFVNIKTEKESFTQKIIITD